MILPLFVVLMMITMMMMTASAAAGTAASLQYAWAYNNTTQRITRQQDNQLPVHVCQNGRLLHHISTQLGLKSTCSDGWMVTTHESHGRQVANVGD